MTGSLIADRFELLEEMPRVTDGRLFHARDLAFGEEVAVKLLGIGCGMDAPGRLALEIAVRRVQCIAHRHLLRHDSLDTASGVHVREWIHGLSLLDLLRRRRELTADDTFRLLATLPAALDWLTTRDIPIPRPLLGKIFVQFDPTSMPEALVTRPIAGWPPFAVKVNPFSIRGLLSDTTSDTSRTTVLDARTVNTVPENLSAPRVFAELLYELLGGRQREADSRRYSPISALHEEGNGVLRRALLVAPHSDCQELWQDLRKAQGSDVAPGVPLSITHSPPRPLEVPAPPLGTPDPGLSLILTPEDPASPAIHLVARPQFTIGRSLQSADFVTRFLPEYAANNALTDRLSRIHVVADITGGRLVVRDGNGSAPSVNGSLSKTTSSLPTIPRPSATGRSWDWATSTFSSSSPCSTPRRANGPPAARRLAPRGVAAPRAARAPWSSSRAMASRSSVRASGFSPRSVSAWTPRAHVWDTRALGESPAAFHFHRGAFWLRNHSCSPNSLTIGGTERSPRITPRRSRPARPSASGTTTSFRGNPLTALAAVSKSPPCTPPSPIPLKPSSATTDDPSHAASSAAGATSSARIGKMRDRGG